MTASGRNPGGRPPVDPAGKRKLRSDIGATLGAEVDAYAAEHGVTEAAAVRELLRLGVQAWRG